MVQISKHMVGFLGGLKDGVGAGKYVGDYTWAPSAIVTKKNIFFFPAFFCPQTGAWHGMNKHHFSIHTYINTRINTFNTRNKAVTAVFDEQKQRFSVFGADITQHTRVSTWKKIKVGLPQKPVSPLRHRHLCQYRVCTEQRVVEQRAQKHEKTQHTHKNKSPIDVHI